MRVRQGGPAARPHRDERVGAGRKKLALFGVGGEPRVTSWFLACAGREQDWPHELRESVAELAADVALERARLDAARTGDRKLAEAIVTMLASGNGGAPPGRDRLADARGRAASRRALPGRRHERGGGPGDRPERRSLALRPGWGTGVARRGGDSRRAARRRDSPAGPVPRRSCPGQPQALSPLALPPLALPPVGTQDDAAPNDPASAAHLLAAAIRGAQPIL